MPVGQINSYSIESNIIDISDEYEQIQLPDTPFLNTVQTGEKVKSRQLKWWDSQRQYIATRLAAAFTAGAISITVLNSDGIRINSIIQIENSIYKVSAVNHTMKVITISALLDDANHANGAKVELVNNAEVEGAEYKDSDRTPDVERYNVTQIMDDFVNITGTEEAVENEVRANVLAKQTNEKLERLKRLINKMVIMNPRIAPTDNASARVFGGLRWFIKQYGYNPSASAFTTDNLDAFLTYCANELGYTPTTLWMNPETHRLNFNPLSNSKIIIQQNDPQRGNYVKSYISSNGSEISLRVDPSYPLREIFSFDPSKLKIRPLRPWFIEKLGKSGDFSKWQIVGEYTFQVRQSNQMGIFTTL